MIVSFGDSDTEDIWLGNRIKRLPIEIQQIGRRKLRMLNSSSNWLTLRHLHLTASRNFLANSRDFRINDKWRIIFRWETGNAFEVEILDYH